MSIYKEPLFPVESTDTFITTTSGMSGYFAVCMWWNDGVEDNIPQGFWEPWNTGFGRYATKEEAEREAKEWAKDEDIEFKP